MTLLAQYILALELFNLNGVLIISSMKKRWAIQQREKKQQLNNYPDSLHLWDRNFKPTTLKQKSFIDIEHYIRHSARFSAKVQMKVQWSAPFLNTYGSNSNRRESWAERKVNNLRTEKDLSSKQAFRHVLESWFLLQPWNGKYTEKLWDRQHWQKYP